MLMYFTPREPPNCRQNHISQNKALCSDCRSPLTGKKALPSYGIHRHPSEASIVITYASYHLKIYPVIRVTDLDLLSLIS
jgi:hypothetical protein